MGFPIRTSADHRSLASPHGLSQRATSFIASWRQGIHRTLLSRSITTITRTQDQNPRTPPREDMPRPAPHDRDGSCQNSAQPHSLTHITNQSRFTCQTTRHDPHPRQGAPRPAANSVMQRSPAPGPARERDTSKTLETVGIEPTTPCLQSRCSPTELRPHTPLHGHEGSS